MNLHAASHREIAQMLMVRERCSFSSLARKGKARVEKEAHPGAHGTRDATRAPVRTG